ncbi:MAG TPA: phytanoyl-CoA dioxygenase family protein [Candidatus Obscuribacterales bacterium]
MKKTVADSQAPPIVPAFSCRGDENWLKQTIRSLQTAGYAVVLDVFDGERQEQTGQALRRAARALREDVGEELLRSALELSIIRFLLKYEPFFFTLLELPQMLCVVDGYLSPDAILRYQVGVILPAASQNLPEHRVMHHLHVNFRHIPNVPRLALDCVLLVTGLSTEAGGVEVFPGSHRRSTPPLSAEDLGKPVMITAPAGSMLVMDGALWHRELPNDSTSDKLYVTHQFAPPIVKPQIDLCASLGESTVRSLPDRTRRLLGWEARVPASPQDFYLPPERRLYQA